MEDDNEPKSYDETLNSARQQSQLLPVSLRLSTQLRRAPFPALDQNNNLLMICVKG